MPLHLVLGAVYVFAAIAAGGALMRVGGASGASGLAFGGAVFLALVQVHVLVLYRREAKARTAEFEKIRADQAQLTEELAEARAKTDELEARLRMETKKRAESIAAEREIIDQLAERLQEGLDAQQKRRPAPDSDSPLNLTDPMLEAVREALGRNRVELHLQPIVALPSRRVAFYEGFTRLRDETGNVIMPSEFLAAAEEAGLLTLIDNVLLVRCVQIVRRLSQKDRRIGIFCNLSINSLRDELFFPQFYEFMRENKDLEGSLIFELGQEAYEGRTSIEARNMAKLIDLGFRFSIDKVRHVDVDLADLERSGVRFFKADANTFLHEIVDGGMRPKSAISREITPHDVPAIFQRYGVELIAEKIESERLVVEILDFDIGYAQGHLFGAPRPVKGELLEELSGLHDFIPMRGKAARG